MHSVFEYIDRHLDQELDLKALASVAHFSSFHFHRVFFSWTGETLGDYLRRRRLEIAATRLAGQPNCLFSTSPALWDSVRPKRSPGHSKSDSAVPRRYGGPPLRNSAILVRNSAVQIRELGRLVPTM
jgi:AraC-like DNA-binding protein